MVARHLRTVLLVARGFLVRKTTIICDKCRDAVDNVTTLRSDQVVIGKDYVAGQYIIDLCQPCLIWLFKHVNHTVEGEDNDGDE